MKLHTSPLLLQKITYSTTSFPIGILKATTSYTIIHFKGKEHKMFFTISLNNALLELPLEEREPSLLAKSMIALVG